MNADEFQGQVDEGRAAAEELLEPLRAGYERILRRFAALAATSFRVLTAAADWQPPPEGTLGDPKIAASADAVLRKSRRRIVDRVGVSALEAFGLAWDVANPLTDEMLEGAGLRTGENLGAAVQPVLRDAIAEAYEEGLSVVDAGTLIRTKLEDAAVWQSEMLARTDLNGLANGASVAAARVAGVTQKTWLTAADERVREEHMDANGQTVPAEQPFMVGGEQLMYPGDPSGSDENVINCRCTVIYAESAVAEKQAREAVTAAAEEAMNVPYHVEKSESCPTSKPYAVVKDADGKVMGCHMTRGDAGKQMAALYANEPKPKTASVIGEALVRIRPDTRTFSEPAESVGEALAEAVVRMGILTASAVGLAPATPPRDWFFMPEAAAPTPLTVTADGQVYGHMALWESCHTGYPGSCVPPPRSPSGYTFYNLGEVECEGGARVAAGAITLATLHADTNRPLTANAVRSHYEDTGVVAAYVRATDGEHGIWVSGALRASLSEQHARDLMGAKPSGDWRQMRPGGPLEMLGVHAVNEPGYPVPRLVASALLPSGNRLGFEFGETDDAMDRKVSVLAVRAEHGVEGLTGMALD